MIFHTTHLRIAIAIVLLSLTVAVCNRSSSDKQGTSIPVASVTESPSAAVEAKPPANQIASSVVKIPPEFEGTYLSSIYMEELAKTKSHITALRAADQSKVYVVVAVSPGSAYPIHSNNNYDDEFAVDPNEFEHNWTRQDPSTLSDANGNTYQRISKDSSYEAAVMKYYFTQLLGSKKYEDSKGNTLEADLNGGVRLNGSTYSLNLYGLRGQKDKMDLIVSREHYKNMALQVRDGAIHIYDVQLYDVQFKQLEGPELEVDESSLHELYAFHE
jgi:hypothetical protein